MKKFTIIIIFFLIVLIGCNKAQDSENSSLLKDNSDVIKYKIDDPQKFLIVATEWSPYTSNALEGKGFLTELTVKALKEAGYSADIQFYPWARALDMVKTGKADGIIGVSYTKERTKFLKYPEVLWINNVFLFSNKKNANKIKFTSLKSIAPASIGILNGSFLQNILVEDGIKLEMVNDVETNIKKLVYGRIDYFAEAEVAVNYVLNNELKDYKDLIAAVDPPIVVDKVYVAFSLKSNKSMLAFDSFNKSLLQMKNSGEYARIIQKYGLKYRAVKKK